MAEDYYAQLGVDKDATSQDIKKAFRQIARECHPDVAGENAEAEERFKNARIAYEALMDPVARARYDRRGERRTPSGGGSFFDAFYKATGRGQPDTDRRRDPNASYGGGPVRGAKPSSRGNDVGLEDLFNDFGFGAGERSGRTNVSSEAPFGGGPAPRPGDDIYLDFEVPLSLARDGGSRTIVYNRLQRSDSWRPGSPDPGLIKVQDIRDIRLLPGTREGEVLRERGLGQAGAFGGSYGDLVLRVRLIRDVEAPPPRATRPPPVVPPPVVPPPVVPPPVVPPPVVPPPAEPPPAAEPSAATDGAGATPPVAEAEVVVPEVLVVDINLAEALLGGRVVVETPKGRVRVAIPACTSSGTRLRLRGRGAEGDLLVELRIVVPERLDERGVELVEALVRHQGLTRDA